VDGMSNQRVTIDGEEFDVLGRYLPDGRPALVSCTHVAYLRKVEQPKESESEKIWRALKERMELWPQTFPEQSKFRLIADAIKAEIKEELLK
jgi:hypothetical protein